MFFLPISLRIENVFLGMLFLSTVFNPKKRTPSNIKYYLLAFFLFTLINGFLNNYFIVEKENFLRLLPFIFLPFCLEKIDAEIKLKGLIFLLIGILIIQLHSVYGIIDYYYFTEGKKYPLKNYSKINEILNYERPYLGFFSVLNIIICFYYFSVNKKKVLSIFICSFSIGLIIVVSARLAIIIVVLISLIAMCRDFKRKNIAITLVTLIGLVLIIMTSNSSLKDRFSQISKDARVVTWKGAISLYFKSSNYIFGSGSEQNTRDNLLEHYENYDEFCSEDEKNRFINKNYNTHNQYINELLRGGIVGLLLLLIPQIILFYCGIIRNDTLTLMFLVAILSFSFVENILGRQVGVYLYVLLLILTSIPYKAKNK
jgi:O-antigen ligase